MNTESWIGHSVLSFFLAGLQQGMAIAWFGGRETAQAQAPKSDWWALRWLPFTIKWEYKNTMGMAPAAAAELVWLVIRLIGA